MKLVKMDKRVRSDVSFPTFGHLSTPIHLKWKQKLTQKC